MAGMIITFHFISSHFIRFHFFLFPFNSINPFRFMDLFPFSFLDSNFFVSFHYLLHPHLTSLAAAAHAMLMREPASPKTRVTRCVFQALGQVPVEFLYKCTSPMVKHATFDVGFQFSSASFLFDLPMLLTKSKLNGHGSIHPTPILDDNRPSLRTKARYDFQRLPQQQHSD